MTARLAAADRYIIGQAKLLAELRGPALREHTRISDPALAMATALGECQHVLRELAAIIERIADGGQA